MHDGATIHGMYKRAHRALARMACGPRMVPDGSLASGP